MNSVAYIGFIARVDSFGVRDHRVPCNGVPNSVFTLIWCEFTLCVMVEEKHKWGLCVQLMHVSDVGAMQGNMKSCNDRDVRHRP